MRLVVKWVRTVWRIRSSILCMRVTIRQQYLQTHCTISHHTAKYCRAQKSLAKRINASSTISGARTRPSIKVIALKMPRSASQSLSTSTSTILWWVDHFRKISLIKPLACHLYKVQYTTPKPILSFRKVRWSSIGRRTRIVQQGARKFWKMCFQIPRLISIQRITLCHVDLMSKVNSRPIRRVILMSHTFQSNQI